MRHWLTRFTVKSQIFVRYLISYFRTFEKVLILKPYENFFLLWDPRFSTSFYIEAFESTKISSYEPVSSQKYENGYRTKSCNFTVLLVTEKSRREAHWNLLLLSQNFLYRTYLLLFKSTKFNYHMQISFCFEALKFQRHFFFEVVESTNWVCTNQFQVKVQPGAVKLVICGRPDAPELHASVGRQRTIFTAPSCMYGKCITWCSEIGSLALLDAPEFHASSDVRVPISLHQVIQKWELCKILWFYRVYNHPLMQQKWLGGAGGLFNTGSHTKRVEDTSCKWKQGREVSKPKKTVDLKTIRLSTVWRWFFWKQLPIKCQQSLGQWCHERV